MVNVLVLLLACAPAPAPPAPSPANPWADAAAMDKRAPIPLTPMMAEHQKGMMRDHLAAVQEIVVGLAAEDWPAITVAAGRLGSSPRTTMMCEHMGAGAPGFTERGLAFHTTADRIGIAAAAKDKGAAVTALGDTLAACTSCHDGFRQDIVTDAEYAAATGAKPPNHSAAPG